MWQAVIIQAEWPFSGRLSAEGEARCASPSAPSNSHLTCLIARTTDARDQRPSLRRHLRQAKGRNVLAVPAFMATMVNMFATSNSSADRGQTSALAVQPEARKAS